MPASRPRLHDLGFTTQREMSVFSDVSDFSDTIIPDVPDIFDALANPTRRRLLEILADAPSSAGSLAEQFELSRPAVSEHLGVLRRAELVRDHVEGRERIYELNADPLADVSTWLRPFEHYWRSQLTNLTTLLEGETEP